MFSGKAVDCVSEDAVLTKEKAAISADRQVRIGIVDPAVWCGVGLSGGGIRSASLALGVLQALAEKDLLKHFDYLSSVSGGGFLASSLQWWWSKSPREDKPAEVAATFGVGPTDFPYGPAHPKWSEPPGPGGVKPKAQGVAPSAAERGPLNLSFLRANSSYLIAGDGLNIWSMLGVVLRTVIISLLIWIPLLTFAFAIINTTDDLVVGPFALSQGLLKPLGGSLFGSDPAYRWLSACRDFKCDLSYPATFALLLLAFYLIAFVFVCSAALFALLSRSPQETPARRSVAQFVIGLMLAVTCIWYLLDTYPSRDFTVTLLITGLIIFSLVAIAIIATERLTDAHLNASYALRRFLEKAIGKAFVPALAILAVASVPLLPQYAATKISTVGGSVNGSLAGGAIGVLGGVGSALYSYYTFVRSAVPRFATQIALTIGAAIYLYASLIIAYVLSLALLHPEHIDTSMVGQIRLVILGSVLLALALGAVANINYVGLHRFYRDRLMEAFMPTDTSVSRMHSTFSPVADSLNISALKSSLNAGPGFTPRPYPLLNANVILIGDKDKRVAARGGDNFMISPLFVGSSATGWQDTDKYIAANGPLTLATAMAASGAAATASAGYIGTGITMNPIVAAAMAFLNIRLGLWIGNPNRRRSKIALRSIPTFLKPGLYSGIFARSRSRDSHFIELTDGGHFENLALYELVRRKLRVILVVDGEADATISLSSLVSAAHRIQQDFGACLEFVDGRGPERLMMYPEKGYPADLKYAQSPFVVGKIIYNNGTTGALIYIKSTLIKDMDFTTSGYLAGHPEFPHQSTTDQFFDPYQFDAYRLLGYESAQSAITELQLDKNIRRPDVILIK